MHGEEVPIALVLVLGVSPSTSATRSTSVANAFMPSSTRSISRRAGSPWPRSDGRERATPALQLDPPVLSRMTDRSHHTTVEWGLRARASDRNLDSFECESDLPLGGVIRIRDEGSFNIGARTSVHGSSPGPSPLPRLSRFLSTLLRRRPRFDIRLILRVSATCSVASLWQSEAGIARRPLLSSCRLSRPAPSSRSIAMGHPHDLGSDRG